MRVAAIQLESVIGDVEANLAACQRLADTAAHEGAEWIILCSSDSFFISR
jgi:predicted amidohydrolase